MSTELGSINGTHLTRFYGGDDRGVSIQLTGENGYVQFNAPEIVALMPELKAILDMELQRKKNLCEQAIKDNKELMKTIVKDMVEVSNMAISQPVFDTASLLLLGSVSVDKTESEE